MNYPRKDRHRMFDVNIISTGSKGNCVIIDGHFMLDAGVTKKLVSNSEHNGEEFDWNNLKRLFISHKHADHANLPLLRHCLTLGLSAEVINRPNGEEVLSISGKPQLEIHIPRAVYRLLKKEDKFRISNIPVNLDLYLAKYDNVHFHEDHEPFTYMHDGFSYFVELHPQKHHDIINYGITIRKHDKRDHGLEVMTPPSRLLYCTDLDTVEPTDVGPGLTSLGMFDTILLEGNFDELWLREYIQNGVNYVNPDVDADTMTDEELNTFVRTHYRQMPKDVSAGLFRAVQNMRHLSKQQARAYVREHLKPSGSYYEIHRSSQFYEKPVNALNEFLGIE